MNKIFVSELTIMNEEFTINNRIQQIMQEKRLSNAAFADIIGVKRSSITHLLSERNKPSLDFLYKLLETFNDIDANWLLKGEKQQKTHVISQSQQELFPEFPSVSLQQQEQQIAPVQPQEHKPSVPKRIEKIVTFYSDKTFEEYFPE